MVERRPAARPPQRVLGIYLVAGVALIAVYFLLPPAVQNLALIASNLTALTAILVSWRTRGLRPTSGWLLVAAFPAATAVGNVVYFVNDSILHVNPFPSIGDAAFLGGYLFLAAGLLRLQQARSAGRDVSAVLDTAIISVGFAAASWVYFMADLVHDPSLSLIERLTAVGYPVADILVVAVTARFFLTARRRGPVFAWLAGTVLVMVTADTVFAVLNLLEIYETGNAVDALILAYNLGWGAVALHRDAAELTLPAPTGAGRSGGRRLAVLVTASLIAPVLLLLESLGGQFTDVPVLSGSAALLFLLVVARMVGLVRDVEAALARRQELEAELEDRAHRDDLTGLANRRMFVEQLQRALDHRAGAGVQVLFIDLDRFKAVNDSLGHKAGDHVLKVTAQRLVSVLAPDDLVARLGGDEFAVLLGPSAADRPSRSPAAALVEEIERPMPFQGLDVQVSASIGHADGGPGDTVEDLMHHADLEMYAEKTRVDRRRSSLSPPCAPGTSSGPGERAPDTVADGTLDAQGAAPR